MSEFTTDSPQPKDEPTLSDNAPTSGSDDDILNEDNSQASDTEAPNEALSDNISETADKVSESEIGTTPDTHPTAQQYIEQGGIHKGRVTRVTTETVFVVLDGDIQGYVPLIEFAAQPVPKENDEILVIAEKIDADSGLLVLSKRHADGYTFWESVQIGDEIEGVVTGMNKGGLDIDIGGAKAFLPGSQVDVRQIRDISTLIGEHIRCIVMQVDRTTQDLVVSRRKYIDKERKIKRDNLINTLVEGEIHTGTVSNVTDFGAFVDLGGLDGLLHVTDMSWSRIGHPKEVVREGQQIDVRVLKVNKQSGKISLGLKQTKPNPWENIDSKYPEGAKITGKVTHLADFGAFLELEEDIDALLPTSEMSWSRRINHPSELLVVGDILEVVVLKTDVKKKRISVGLKQTEENPWTKVEEQFQTNTMVKGRVSKITDFGAFVELAPGIEGLIHISELSHKRVKAVTDVLREGQDVDVRILKIDKEEQRISLSMKQGKDSSSPAGSDAKPAKAKKKRKKPLRGGLTSHFQWW